MAERDRAAAEQQLQDAVVQNNRSTESLVALANFLRLSGQSDRAEPLYQEAISKAPKDAAPRIDLGWFYAQSGQRAKAEDQFRAVRDMHPKDPRYRGMVATYYLTLQDWPAAIAEMERLAAADNTDLANRARLAGTYYFAGRIDDAKRTVRAVLKEEKTNPLARLISGILNLNDGKVEESVADLNVAVHEAPDSATAYYFLGLCLSRKGDRQMAQQNVEKAIESNPHLLAARLWLADDFDRQGSFDTANQLLLAVPPDQRTNPLIGLRLVRGYLGQHLDSAAGDELRSVLATNANERNVPLLYRMGFADVLDRQPEVVRQALEKGLNADPKSAELLTLVAHTYVVAKQPDQAINRVQQQLQAHPELGQSMPHLALLGQLQKDAGRLAAARDTLQRAIEASNAAKSDAADAWVGLVQVELGLGDLPAAKSRCEEITTRWPKMSAGWMWLGSIEERQNDFLDAVAHYGKAVDLDANNAPAANNLSWRLASDGGDLNRALDLAQKAVRLEPGNPSFEDTLGWVHYKMGHFPQAVTVLQDAVKAAPARTIYHYHLALAFHQAQEDVQALQELEAALRLDSSFPDAPAARDLVRDLHVKLGK